MQFEAGDEVATVTSSVPVEQAAGLIGAYGSVEGRVETLTSRRGLGFTLYDLEDVSKPSRHRPYLTGDGSTRAWRSRFQQALIDAPRASKGF